MPASLSAYFPFETLNAKKLIKSGYPSVCVLFLTTSETVLSWEKVIVLNLYSRFGEQPSIAGVLG